MQMFTEFYIQKLSSWVTFFAKGKIKEGCWLGKRRKGKKWRNKIKEVKTSRYLVLRKFSALGFAWLLQLLPLSFFLNLVQYDWYWSTIFYCFVEVICVAESWFYLSDTLIQIRPYRNIHSNPVKKDWTNWSKQCCFICYHFQKINLNILFAAFFLEYHFITKHT